MKWPLYLLIFILVSCSTVVERFPASKLERHVVFDIDYTIVSEIKRPTKDILKNKRVVMVQGTHYYINEGIEDFVNEILSHKDMKISFYSGGKAIRNNELLSKIKLSNGKSFKDIAYKILSFEDLYKVEGVSETAKFAERYKKDLSKISKNLDQLIHFDDSAHFFLENADNQINNFFFIGKAFEFFEKYEDTKGLSGEFVPQNYNQWLLEKKKLYILNGAFKDAYAEAKDGSMTFSEAMKKREDLLNLKDRKWNELSSSYYKAFYGKDIVKVMPASMDCAQMMKTIMGL